MPHGEIILSGDKLGQVIDILMQAARDAGSTVEVKPHRLRSLFHQCKAVALEHNLATEVDFEFDASCVMHVKAVAPGAQATSAASASDRTPSSASGVVVLHEGEAAEASEETETASEALVGLPAAASLRMGHLCPEGTLAHLGAFNKVVEQPCAQGRRPGVHDRWDARRARLDDARGVRE